MTIPPILAAYYLIAYRTPEHSQSWGLWKTAESHLPPAYHHDPERLLSNGYRDIASVYTPVIGPYDSGDPDVCEYHILLAKAAGIDCWLVDWLDQLSSPEAELDVRNVDGVLAMAEKLDFKIALCFQDAACFPPRQPNVGQRDQAMQAAVRLLRQVQTRCFQSPAYLRFDGRPVLTTLNTGVAGEDWNSAFFTAEEWDQLRQAVGENIFLIQNYQPRRVPWDFSPWDSVYPGLAVYLSDYETDEDFWEHAEHALGHGRFQLISGLVTPGFDDRGVGGRGLREPRVFSRRQGAKYIAAWEDNIKRGPRFIQINSWNNHGDGTCIEPAKEIVLHKNAAAPGWGYRELIATREYAVRFTKKKLWSLPALFLPERLYRLRKSGAPANRGDRIRLYLLENDITGATLGLEHAGV